jgi:hypothetical protein
MLVMRQISDMYVNLLLVSFQDIVVDINEVFDGWSQGSIANESCKIEESSNECSLHADKLLIKQEADGVAECSTNG